MRDRTIKQVIAGIEKRGPGDGRHSDVYRLLRAKHGVLAPRLANGQMGWACVAAELAEAGLVGRRGDPPTANALRRVWQRVCRDVELEAASKSAAKQKSRASMPSRMPKDWRPTEVALQSDSRAVALAPTRYGASPSTALSPTQPISGSQNSAVTSTPPDFPTVDPAGNPLPEGFVWYDNEAVLLRVALGVWGAIEGAKLIDLQRAGLAR